MWSMFADKNFRKVHHKQHKNQVDSIVFKPMQRLPPALNHSVLHCVLVLVKFADENKLGKPHLVIITSEIDIKRLTLNANVMQYFTTRIGVRPKMMTIFMEIVSCCRTNEIALSPQKNPRLTLSTKNSMKIRQAAAVNLIKKCVE